jgi:hypothetical protein
MFTSVKFRKIFSFRGWDIIVLLIILTTLIWKNLDYQFWKNPRRIIAQDVILYYEYLPAAIIHQDLSMDFVNENPSFYVGKIWLHKTSTGRSVSKMTMGLAVLYTPFFMIAHELAGHFGYDADGYSEPYRIALIFSSVFYATLGLWFLILLLRRYFPRGIVALTILAIGLGTNLFFYTTIEPPMSHAYSFFLIATFTFFVDSWVQKQSWFNSVMLGLVAGLIILVRPTNGIVLILLPLWKVTSFASLFERLKLFLHKSLKIILIILIICAIFVPQIIYWKYTTGQYFYYSYGDERFFFNDPAFIKGLFSYRKGWLVYTPIMSFALLGIIVLYFRKREFFWPVALYTFLNLYIVLSWWCWWYGGGFGHRAMIDSYGVLAIPLASFMNFIFEKKIKYRVALLVVTVCFISLNIFQSWQYYVGAIHWDSMNKKTYWDSYFRVKIRPGFYQMVDNPDYKAALKGDR